MSIESIIQAWKDEEYRTNLSEAELALLPEHPAGLMELTDEALDALIAGVEKGGSCCWSSCNTTITPTPAPAPVDPVPRG